MSEIASGATGAWSYRAGGWFAVFGSKVTILLPESERDRVVSLWGLVDAGAGFDEVLDGLLAAGLSTLPGFVLVSTDHGPTRVLLRGQGVTASLSGAEGQVELDGAAGHTWVERTAEGVTSLQINLPESGGDGAVSGDVVDFPIITGLVRVSRVDRPGATAAAIPATPAAAGTVGAPPAVPPPGEPTDPVAADPVMLEPEVQDDPGPAVVGDEPSPLDDGADEATAASVVGDPLTDPLPDGPDDAPADGPDGAPGEEPAAEPPSSSAETEVIPEVPAPPPAPGWIPPPPSGPPAGAAVDAPPLTVGSWQPLGGSTPPPPGPPPGSASDVDHDGLTVAGAGEQPAPPVAPGIPGQPPAPPITQPVAKLVVSDGQTIVVDRAVLIGRAPEARRFNANEQPALVTVPSRLHEISSTHIEVRPGSGADHGSAVVTDMGSTNGTVLVQPGLGPEDLKPGIAVQLIPGAVINLGDGVTIQVTRP